jgi:enoyl-[acyl-carrier protein] reductase I
MRAGAVPPRWRGDNALPFRCRIQESQGMGFLAGKRALIVGIASSRSIAWGIAQAMHHQGAALAFTYQNDKLKSRVEEAAAQFGGGPAIECDVAHDEHIERTFAALEDTWADGFDILVHSVAYAPREELQGNFAEVVTREGFRQAHEVSAYSFAALAKAAHPRMREGGALLTLTYLGAVRALPNYNVMGLAKASLEAAVRYLAAGLGPRGLRVNAISAGPIRTLAASGISGLRSMLDAHAEQAPLRRNVTIEEVGNAAAFLCSDLASGITGEITYVDAGYNVVAAV